MGLHGDLWPEVRAVWSARPLTHLNRDFQLPNSDDAFYEFLRDHPLTLYLDGPPLARCDETVARIRNEGNRFYLAGDHHAAFGKYNESICIASVGSEHAGIGYANRSAIY